MLKGIRHQFERFTAREAAADGSRAVLGIRNGWYVGERRVMDEVVTLDIQPVRDGARAVDLAFRWTPVGKPVRLVGAEGKSYGGVTLRYAPGTNTVITTPLGTGSEDLYMTRLPWADLTRRLDQGSDGRPITAGAALFISPDHPDYPPTWLTRHYGVLCLGWPGVGGKSFAPGETFRCNYRVWIHSGPVTGDRLAAAYAAYAAGGDECLRYFGRNRVRTPSAGGAGGRPRAGPDRRCRVHRVPVRRGDQLALLPGQRTGHGPQRDRDPTGSLPAPRLAVLRAGPGERRELLAGGARPRAHRFPGGLAARSRRRPCGLGAGLSLGTTRCGKPRSTITVASRCRRRRHAGG